MPADLQTFPQGRVVIDLETDGLSPYDGSRPFLYGAEDEAGTVLMIDSDAPGFRKSPEFLAFKRVVEDRKVEKIAHNAKFELGMLYHDGMNPAGRWHDTMIMAHLLNEYDRLGLEVLSKKYLGFKYASYTRVSAWLRGAKRAFVKQLGRAPNYRDAPRNMLRTYLEDDLDCTMKLFWLWIEPVERLFSEVYAWELRLIPHVASMERAGIMVNRAHCVSVAKRTAALLVKAEAECRALSKEPAFNPGSAPQVMAALQKRGLTPRPGKDGRPCVRAKQLLELQDELADAVIAYRDLDKIRNTYMLPFLQLSMGDALHCSFWQCGEDKGIKTGRFSASKPSLQNIPIRIGGRMRAGLNSNQYGFDPAVARMALVPRPGHAFVFIDYSQIELCIFAHYADDQKMIEGFKAGFDFHLARMFQVFPRDIPKGLTLEEAAALSDADKLPKELKLLRFKAKSVSFSLLYGMGLKSLAAVMGATVSEAREVKDAYMAACPSIARLSEDLKVELYRHGFITDIFGRRYRVPPDLVYKTLNALIQGTAAHVLKHGMVCAGDAIELAKLEGRIKPSVGMRMTIHDELCFESPLEEMPALIAVVTPEMEDWTTFKVPIRVDVEWSDKSWGHKEAWHG